MADIMRRTKEFQQRRVNYWITMKLLNYGIFHSLTRMTSNIVIPLFAKEVVKMHFDFSSGIEFEYMLDNN